MIDLDEKKYIFPDSEFFRFNSHDTDEEKCVEIVKTGF